MILITNLFYTSSNLLYMGAMDVGSPYGLILNELHREVFFYLVVICGFVLYLMTELIVEFWYKLKYPFELQDLENRNKILHGMDFADNVYLEVVWTFFPALVLGLIAYPSLEALYYVSGDVKSEIFVSVSASQWYWTYEISCSIFIPEIFSNFREFITIGVGVPKDDVVGGEISLEKDEVESWVDLWEKNREKFTCGLAAVGFLRETFVYIVCVGYMLTVIHLTETTEIFGWARHIVSHFMILLSFLAALIHIALAKLKGKELKEQKEKEQNPDNKNSDNKDSGEK